jgi:hypothetical protein
MDTRDEILITIGLIEGKLEAFATLSQRVRLWSDGTGLKGGWFVRESHLPGITSVTAGRTHETTDTCLSRSEASQTLKLVGVSNTGGRVKIGVFSSYTESYVNAVLSSRAHQERHRRLSWALVIRTPSLLLPAR